MTCTQEELLQVLSKLMQERQKVKALELRIARDAPSPALPVNDTHQKEIEQLQKIIRDQSEQLSKPSPTVSTDHFKQEIIQLQAEITRLKSTPVPATYEKEASALKEANARLNEEIIALKKSIPETTIPDFSFELETTEKALKEAQLKIGALEQAVLQARHDAPAFHEEELENFRLQARELHAARKELEMKLSLALQDKQSLQQELGATQQSALKLKHELEFFQKNSHDLDQKDRELLSAQTLVHELQSTNAHLLQSLEKALQNQEMVEKQEEELNRQKAALKQLEKETEAQKGEIALLEEHLTRRIKECTHLSADQEEKAAELTKKERKIERLESEFQQLQESSTQDIASFKSSLAAAEEELSEIQALLEEQEEELYELKKIAERFHELEELLSQSYKILTKRADNPKRAIKKAAPSSDLFMNQKSSRRYDLFE